MAGISILDGERNNLSLKSNLVSRSFAVLMCILVFAASAFSQTGTSGITGVISDQQGRSIGGAKITLTNLGTNATRTTVSTDAGVYIFDLLPPADYRIEIEAAGFRRSVVDNAKALIGKQTEVNVRLEEPVRGRRVSPPRSRRSARS